MDRDYISGRFANIRGAKNISARQLSLELGQSSQYINQIETRNKFPSMEVFFAFCDYFKITAKEFFDDDQNYPIQYRALIHELNKLDGDELEKIIAIVRAINKNKK